MKKKVLITGVNGGIGRALVDAYVKAGYQVIATDFRNMIWTSNEVKTIDIDLQEFVHNSAYADDKVNKLSDLIGDHGLDVLINNAAVQILGGMNNLTRNDWRTSLDVNLIAPFLLTQALLISLEKCSGCVINISSIHARLTKRNFIAYATSKAALSGMTRAMAIDLGNRIRVNAIEPAAIGTEMLKASFSGKTEELDTLESCHPVNRIGKPEEVAELALTISEGKYGFLHGACIPLDGGIGARLHDPI